MEIERYKKFLKVLNERNNLEVQDHNYEFNPMSVEKYNIDGEEVEIGPFTVYNDYDDGCSYYWMENEDTDLTAIIFDDDSWSGPRFAIGIIKEYRPVFEEID